MRERDSKEKEIKERIESMKIEEEWSKYDDYALRIKQDIKLDKDESVKKSANEILNLVNAVKILNSNVVKSTKRFKP